MNRKFGSKTFSLLMLLALISPGTLAQESPVERSVALSLGPGEEILPSESFIAMSVEEDEMTLVISKGAKGPFYFFRRGEKIGPFSKIEEVMSAAYQGRKRPSDGKNDCAAYKPGPAPAGAQPASSPAGNGGQMLGYGGKTFGPFLLVFNTQITPDGSRLYYAASDKDKAWFGCSDGRQISFGGIPTDFKFSPDGKNAAVIVEGTATMAEMENMGKMPPEKLSAAIQAMEKIFLYTIDGGKFGPFGKDLGPGDFWYPAVSNDLYFKVDDQIYRNGKPFLKDDSIDSCSFYPCSDGRSYAIHTYENIVFSDGQKYPYPLDLAVFLKNGKTVFKWVALENNRDLVIYRRSM